MKRRITFAPRADRRIGYLHFIHKMKRSGEWEKTLLLQTSFVYTPTRFMVKKKRDALTQTNIPQAP